MMLPHSLYPLTHILLDQTQFLIVGAQTLFVPAGLVFLPQLAQGEKPGVDDAEAAYHGQDCQQVEFLSS